MRHICSQLHNEKRKKEKDKKGKDKKDKRDDPDELDKDKLKKVCFFRVFLFCTCSLHFSSYSRSNL